MQQEARKPETWENPGENGRKLKREILGSEI
jgi:hypothetical protein